MDVWTIGSDPQCDVVVDQPTVSARHCRLTRQMDGFYIEDLNSTNGTFVNGQRISSPRQVDPADAITMGRGVPLPWPTVTRAADQRVISIGRDPDNVIVLDRPMVSGHHARLTVRGSELRLEDLGSTNGTHVGSPARRIESAAVSPDDEVFFGSLGIKVRELLDRAGLGPADHVPPDSGRPASAAPRPAPATVRQGTHLSSLLRQVDWREWLLPGLAGAALLVICIVGLLMVCYRPGGNLPGDGPTTGRTDGPSDDNAGGSSKSEVKVGFLMGKFSPHDAHNAVDRIRVTIQIDSNGQDLKEPVDLDLGTGFLLRLGTAATDAETTSPKGFRAVAVPQRASVAADQTTIQAGSTAWFEFSTEEANDLAGERSATPQVLADLWLSHLRTIRFAARGKTNWVLESYAIEINGRLFASHDSVRWRAKQQLEADRKTLDERLARQTALGKETAELEAYVNTGLGGTTSQRELADKKAQLSGLTEEIGKLRESLDDPWRWYTERNPAFRPVAAGTKTESRN